MLSCTARLASQSGTGRSSRATSAAASKVATSDCSQPSRVAVWLRSAMLMASSAMLGNAQKCITGIQLPMISASICRLACSARWLSRLWRACKKAMCGQTRALTSTKPQTAGLAPISVMAVPTTRPPNAMLETRKG